LFADLEAVYNPNEVSQYTIGVNTDNIKKRTVNDVMLIVKTYQAHPKHTSIPTVLQMENRVE
jgi:hypothetical protein